MSWKWKVEDTTPPSAPTPSLDFTYRSINLMCYLMKDTTYDHLYRAPLESALTQILANIAQLPPQLDIDAQGNGNAIQQRLMTHVQAMKTLLDNRNPALHDLVICRNYFVRDLTNATGRETLYANILTEISNLRRDPELNHVCVPFHAIQSTSGPWVPSVDVDNFLDHLGSKKLIDLFTQSKCAYTPAQRAAIEQAKTNGILRTTSTIEFRASGGPQITIVNLLNNYKCVNLTCQPNNGTWCNHDGNGNCTAISD